MTTMRILLAGILGGIAMFIWSFVAHDVLPLGEVAVREIPNNDAILSPMQTSMDKPGLYMFPSFGLGDNPTKEQKAEAMKHMNEKLATSPSGMILYYPPGRQFHFGKLLGVEFLTEVVETILAVLLLAQAGIITFGGRVGFMLVIGIIAGITTNVPYWNWYGYPPNYTAAQVFIAIVQFVVAGIVAALVLGKRTAAA